MDKCDDVLYFWNKLYLGSNLGLILTNFKHAQLYQSYIILLTLHLAPFSANLIWNNTLF